MLLLLGHVLQLANFELDRVILVNEPLVLPLCLVDVALELC